MCMGRTTGVDSHPRTHRPVELLYLYPASIHLLNESSDLDIWNLAASNANLVTSLNN